MNKMFFLFASFMLFNCASKDFKETVVHEPKSMSSKRMFNATFSEVWDGLSLALESNNHLTLLKRKDQGLIITDWQTGKSDRLFSGYGDTKIPYKIRYKHKIIVQPSKQGTFVKIESQEQYLTDVITTGNDFSGSLYQWYNTKSSGYKESLLLDEVDQQLSQSRSSK